MHIDIAGVHVNKHTMSLPNFADWGLAYSQPAGLNQDNLMRNVRAPRCGTVVFLLCEPLVASVDGQNHNYSP